MHWNHPISYVVILAFIASIACPALLAWRGWPTGRAIAAGWALIAIVAQTVAVLAFHHPGLFGWTKDEVSIPDAPDIFPTAVAAFFLSACSFAIGKIAQLLIRPRHFSGP